MKLAYLTLILTLSLSNRVLGDDLQPKEVLPQSTDGSFKQVYDLGGKLLVDETLDVTGRIKGYKDVLATSGTFTSFTATYSTMTNLRVTGSAMIPTFTDWKSQTLTMNNFGTISNASFFTRRVGDSLEGTFFFKAGTVAAATASLTLPNSLSADLTKKAGGNSRNFVGEYHISGGGVTAVFTVGVAGVIMLDSSNATLLFFTYNNTTDASGDTFASPMAGSALMNNNGQISGHFMVPISGWTTGN